MIGLMHGKTSWSGYQSREEAFAQAFARFLVMFLVDAVA